MKQSGLLLLVLAIVLSGNLFSQSRGLEIVAKTLGGEHAVAGKQYAVFIAIDSYKEWLPLKNPVKDATEIRDILTSRYYIDQVLELYNGDATKSGVLRLFDTLIRTVKPEDSVLIYYAGHGQLDDTETGFWIPVDAGTDKFEQKNWIPNIQIRNNIGKMQARHVALLSDSCFSGDILNPTRGATPSIDQSYFVNAWNRVSRQVLTSGASESVPDQSEFSQQLKLALRGNNQPYLDPLMIYEQIRLGLHRSTPLFGDLKDSGHQAGASYLLFLKNAVDLNSASTAALVAPSAASADLSVSCSMEGAEVFVDGISYGKSPALASGLPSGRTLKVSASAGSYSASVEVTLAPKELKELSLKLERMKANLLIVSSAKDLSVFVDGEPKGPLGAGLFRDLPAGEVSLELRGEGQYYQGSLSLKGNETARVSVEPWAVGALAYEAPEGASIQISGSGSSGPAQANLPRQVFGTGRLENLPIGTYKLVTSDVGYGKVAESLEVAKGKTAAFKLEAAGTILVKGLASNVKAVKVGGKSYPASGIDQVEIKNLKPGARVSLLIVTSSLPKLELAATPVAGQTLTLSAPAGRLSFDWLPPRSKVTLDGADLPMSSAPGRRATSDTLLAQDYALAVSLPGIGVYSDRVTVGDGAEANVAGLTSYAIAALDAQRVKRRSLDAFGWVSLGVGILGAAGAGATYYLGAQAMNSYTSSTLSSDISSERSKAELYGSLFVAAAILGGSGLATSPILFALGPKTGAIEASAKDLQAQIQALGKAGD